MKRAPAPGAAAGPGHSRLLGLEILRFLSALAILFWHNRHFSYLANQPQNFAPENQPGYSVFFVLYEFGAYGVPIFWCISGFIFFWKYRTSIASRAVGAQAFLVLRFSRLYPLHLLTLLLVAVLQAAYFARHHYYFVYQLNDLKHFLLQLLLASNWLSTAYSFNGPIWSISVEVLIYGAFFLLLRYFSASWLLNIAIMALCVFAKLHSEATLPVVDCLLYFYAGGLAAIALRDLAPLQRRLLDILSLAFLVCAPLLMFASRLQQLPHFLFVALLLYMPTLLYWIARDFRLAPAARRLVETAGNMSYSSYLLHFPVQLVVALVYTGINRPIPLYNPLFFVCYVGSTLVLAYLAYRFVEMPAQMWLRGRWLGRPPPGAANRNH